LAAVAGCGDPRISLQDFLEMQREPVAPAQPVMPAVAVPVDRYLTPYRVGTGDVLSVTLTGADQAASFLPIQVRVDREGHVDLPTVGRVLVGDKELQEVEEAIKHAFVPAVLKDVAVHVALMEPQTTNVVVLGAVSNPGIVRLRRTERNLLFALATAGGAPDTGAGRATLKRIRTPDEQVTLDLTDPAELEAALALAPLENGDIISVEANPNTIYVGGLVNQPRPQIFPPGAQPTVLQVIAASGGLRTDVTPTEATLIHHQPDGRDVHVKLDLLRITTAKDPNIALAAGDILWVPDTVLTRVQDWVNKNIYIRAGASVNYNVSGIEFLNRRGQQSGGTGGRGGGLQDQLDPYGFLLRNSAIQAIQSQVTAPP
jgi:protein involved in polysaccharide export with SLBB domain